MLLKLSETIASHICHELANSIGACDACLDSVHPSNSEAFETAKLASHSSVTRLKYLRYMYGANIAPLPLSELLKMPYALIKEGRTTLEIIYNNNPLNENSNDIVNLELPATCGKLLFAFIYICHGNLPYGGTIKVEISHSLANQSGEIKISSNSKQIKLRPAIEKILHSEVGLEEMNSRNVVAFYANHIAQDGGVKFNTVTTEEKVEYSFSYQCSDQE
jgi:hypothetical protein